MVNFNPSPENKRDNIELQDYKNELKEFFEWFNPIKKEYGIEFKHEILTKAGIEIYNKTKEWNQKLKSMEASLKLDKDTVTNLTSEFDL